MSFLYIASPYTHDSHLIHLHRFEAVEEYGAKLLLEKRWCYSPIVHCHEIAKKYSLPTTFEYWVEYNKAMLSRAGGVQVLMLPGWEQSKGIHAEVEYWTKHLWQPAIEYVKWQGEGG